MLKLMHTCKMACTWGLMSRRPCSELVQRIPVTWGPMVDSLAEVRPRMRSLRPMSVITSGRDVVWSVSRRSVVSRSAVAT